ncbi:metal ABC transporter solute-binding protein, Zn/Mn family [Deinococcus marmoris]|uniref:Zinc ABC transporter, periplasmic-binding protein ZnuA n=1 Tax=Deinococcus marmoris TaxID=249408 RepID=A0A1U7NX88_9DEIO|nr:zinc ABC transporter substrate-binding protein [Deinococcus marmoris]OLV17526.1 Zinc ABC transporter, periplasmic-binding protein ZnuA [Deinococcus marmoris]
MRGLIILGLLGLASAQAAPLQVSVSNSILADFVRNVGGARVSINEIVPVGADPHSFQPSASVIRGLAGSRVLFVNGAGLEPWLPQVRASAPSVPVRTVTDGLKLRAGGAEAGEEHAGEEHSDFDPHAWWDLGLAAGYVKNIQSVLTALDPAGKASYASNTAAYLGKLSEADAYAKKQFATLPASKRQIVTNHDALNYFAARYGLKLVGAVIPGLSTEREPSARELATLITAVKKSGAKVIFTENTVNVRLAQALAKETGARIAPPLYTDALGPKGSAGGTFLKALRFNVDEMVGALK